MNPTFDLASTQESVSSALVNTTRASTVIASQDVDFHRSLDHCTGQNLERQTRRLLALAGKLLRAAEDREGVPRLSSTDDIDDQWRPIVEILDGLLERADFCLDEFKGLVKRASPRQHSQSPTPRVRASRANVPSLGQDVPKPQTFFEHAANNEKEALFKPILTSKPHAILPYDDSLGATIDGDGHPQTAHPYEVEIRQYHFPPSVYTHAEPRLYQPFENTEAIIVDSVEGVRTMVDELRQATEIAVDLEHHDAHSYIGLVSLMQISTRNRDWIIDTLKPWRRKLEMLNEVFADPKILKVFHGASMDIIWLQRDLGLYVVGLFDTYHAARVLGYRSASLAFLLDKFVKFDAQKQYQLADWRIRPLPQEMLDYARSDTHFLLYIYDCIKNELIDTTSPEDSEANRTEMVLERSKETALRRYEHPNYDAENGTGRHGWLSLIEKSPVLLSRKEFTVFRKVHAWRDQSARREDEGIHEIMPNHVLFSIARSLPQSKSALMSVSRPITPHMRSRADELLEVIKDAIADIGDGQDMIEVLSKAAKFTHPAHSHIPVSTEAVPVRIDGPSVGLRGAISQFWGDSISGEPVKYPKPPDVVKSLQRLAVPLPATALAIDILAQEDGGQHKTAPFVQSSLSPTPDQAHLQMDGSLKRKRSSNNHGRHDEVHGGTRDVDGRNETQVVQMVSTGDSRRLERKTHKHKPKSGQAEPIANLKPFDYDSAPSVLHALSSPIDAKHKRPSRHTISNTADAPSGPKNVHRHGKGRTMIFRPGVDKV